MSCGLREMKPVIRYSHTFREWFILDRSHRNLNLLVGPTILGRFPTWREAVAGLWWKLGTDAIRRRDASLRVKEIHRDILADKIRATFGVEVPR